MSEAAKFILKEGKWTKVVDKVEKAVDAAYKGYTKVIADDKTATATEEPLEVGKCYDCKAGCIDGQDQWYQAKLISLPTLFQNAQFHFLGFSSYQQPPKK